MNGSDYLYTVAEVSVAFVGFAAIVIAVRLRSQEMDHFDRVLVAWLVECALAALGFALLHNLLHFFGVPVERSLPIGSGLLAIYLLSVFVRIRNHYRDPEIPKIVSRRGLLARMVFVGVIFTIQTFAAFGWLPFGPLGRYLLGVSGLLVIAGGIFATILTSPTNQELRGGVGSDAHKFDTGLAPIDGCSHNDGERTCTSD